MSFRFFLFGRRWEFLSALCSIWSTPRRDRSLLRSNLGRAWKGDFPERMKQALDRAALRDGALGIVQSQGVVRRGGLRPGLFSCVPSANRMRLGLALVAALFAIGAQAASIRGVVTDTSGARVKGATVALLVNGQVVASAVSGADGSYEVLTGETGRFFIVVEAKSF